MTKLKVGDVLYENSRYHGLIKHTIIRLTPTTAVTEKGRKYKIDLVESGYTEKLVAAKIIGDYGADPIETDSLKARYEFQQLRRYAYEIYQKFNVHKLNEKQLNEFIQFAKPLSSLIQIDP